MNHLLRERAPITEEGWNELDEEARERLEPGLAARKVVDFAGPHGWDYSATNLGRIEPRWTAFEGVRRARRRVLPLVELRVDFTRHRAPSCRPRARRRGHRPRRRWTRPRGAIAARREHRRLPRLVEAGIRGIAEACTHEAVALSERLQRLHPPHRRGGRDAAAQRHRRPVRARARARTSTPA